MSIAFLKRIFSIDNDEVAGLGELGLLFDKLSDRFSNLSDREIKRLTGFSGMLGKVSYADMEISLDEKKKIEDILVNILSLRREEAQLLVAILVEHRIQLFSVEDYFYSRLINEVCVFDEKKQLIHAMFSVAAADGAVSQEEDASIYAAAKSLRLSHADFISVRKEFAKYLDVLKH